VESAVRFPLFHIIPFRPIFVPLSCAVSLDPPKNTPLEESRWALFFLGIGMIAPSCASSPGSRPHVRPKSLYHVALFFFFFFFSFFFFFFSFFFFFFSFFIPPFLDLSHHWSSFFDFLVTGPSRVLSALRWVKHRPLPQQPRFKPSKPIRGISSFLLSPSPSPHHTPIAEVWPEKMDTIGGVLVFLAFAIGARSFCGPFPLIHQSILGGVSLLSFLSGHRLIEGTLRA